jgi:hypothetical protein
MSGRDYDGNCPAENPRGYCPDHRTGVKFPDVKVTPLQYVENRPELCGPTGPALSRFVPSGEALA